MIKVILPNRGPLASLDAAVISDIVQRLFNTESYDTETEDRRDGRYIKVINCDENIIHYVCLSNPDNSGRNSRLMQFITPAYIAYYNEQIENKKIDAYVISPSGNDKNDYSKMVYRCCVTIGIRILNFEELCLTGLVPFNSYEDFKNCRNMTSGRNSHNRQTYFVEENEPGEEPHISLYGKTFGANTMESFIFALILNEICDKPIVFYQVTDNDSTSIAENQRRILEDKGITFGNDIEVLPNGNAIPPRRRETSRDTAVFHYNLLQKFGEKRCYICGCDIEHMIIGSHIERVTDIDNSHSYSVEEKNHRATDGDNGFWLCANHDKMFEYGIIYFNGRHMSVSRFINSITDKLFIDYSVKTNGVIYPEELQSMGENLPTGFNIKTEHYNAHMHEYLDIHKERVTTM